MSRHTRIIAYAGNGMLALVSGLIMIAALGKGHAAPAVMLALVCGLGIFNIRLIAKASAAASEEEWLAGELRKAEMRRQLVGLAGQGLTDVVPPEVMAKQAQGDSVSEQSHASEEPRR